ncbi:MAG: hypothetical protein Q9205_007496 [Flavoplaca limonia]
MAVDEVGAPELPFSPRERQSKPVHELADPTIGGLMPPSAGEDAGRMDGAACVTEARDDEVGVVATSPPRPRDRQRRPVHGVVDVVAVLSMATTARELVGVEDTAVLPALNERQSKSVQEVVDPVLTATLLLLLLLVVCASAVLVEAGIFVDSPSPIDRHRRPEQERAVPVLPKTLLGDAVITGSGLDVVANTSGLVVEPTSSPKDKLTHSRFEQPKGSVVVVRSTDAVVSETLGGIGVEVALGRRPNEALTQSKLVHPNGSVDEGVAGLVVVVDPDAVGKEVPLGEAVGIGRRLNEALTQSRSMHPKGKVEAGLADVVNPEVLCVVDTPEAKVGLESRPKEALAQSTSVHPNGRDEGEAADVAIADPVAVGAEVLRVMGNEVGKKLNEALTQSKSVHPKGKVGVVLADITVVDIEEVADKGPVAEGVVGRRSREALTQRRSVQPNGKVEVALAGLALVDIEDVDDNDPVVSVLGSRLKEALTQNRSEHPNGKVEEKD